MKTIYLLAVALVLAIVTSKTTSEALELAKYTPHLEVIEEQRLEIVRLKYELKEQAKLTASMRGLCKTERK